MNKKDNCFRVEIIDRENKALKPEEAILVIKSLEKSFDHQYLSLTINNQPEKSFLKFCLDNLDLIKEKLRQHGYRLITFEKLPAAK